MFIKNNTVSMTSHTILLCEICENVCFVAKAFNKKIKSSNMLPTNPHSLAEKYTYDSSSKICMFSENECC